MDGTENRGVRRFVRPVIYLCLLALLMVTAVKIGLSSYYAAVAEATDSDEAAATAIYFDQANPDAHESRGLVALRNESYDDAVRYLQNAVELRPNDHQFWMRLGHARSRSKDFEGAHAAYDTALKFAPNYAQPLKYIGLVLLELGERDAAFRYLSAAAAKDGTLYPEILQLARKQYPGDPEGIERAVNPQTDEARRMTARYLIKYYFMTDSVKAMLTGKELSDEQKDEFVKYLIYKNNTPAAYELWRSKSNIAAVENEESPIFDGGFELLEATDDSGFGWRIEQKIPHLTVTIDSSLAYRGARSLNLKFAGAVATGRRLVSQQILVQPYQNYRLTFAANSSELTSGGLPFVAVYIGNSMTPAVRSIALKGTDGKWESYNVNFKTGDASAAVVSFERDACEGSGCPIFGSLSLDEFSITASKR